jgi:predicted DNA-binding antitoxin AbrB/MazE fold protein
MPLTVEAIYEDGVLKPAQPLPLQEHEKVRLRIEPADSWAERTAGMLPWTGDPEVLRRLAEDDEFGILESPRPSPVSRRAPRSSWTRTR